MLKPLVDVFNIADTTESQFNFYIIGEEVEMDNAMYQLFVSLNKEEKAHILSLLKESPKETLEYVMEVVLKYYRNNLRSNRTETLNKPSDISGKCFTDNIPF